VYDARARARRHSWGVRILVEDEAIDARPVPVDLVSVVTDRLKAWDPEAERNGVKLVSAMATELHALATPEALDRVLDSLLARALAVAPPGSRISVEARVEEPYAEVHVVDEGAVDAIIRLRAA
jgi:signal transduction histidine kinase